MKAIGSLKVGLERNCHGKKMYAPQGAKDTFASHKNKCH
jgi:hypothetical protein